MTDAIPIVSFEKFLTGKRAEQQQVAKQVCDAFSTVGFIYLKDHGIPQSRVDEIFALVSQPQSNRPSQAMLVPPHPCLPPFHFSLVSFTPLKALLHHTLYPCDELFYHVTRLKFDS